MKTQTKKPSANKLVSNFDKMLRNMLVEDIKSFKTQNQFLHSNLQSTAQARLSVA
ncbi:MAG TPA: hypothetical protein VK668_22415 [Mucilaginibacter sp.]|nr:hypothetical protein [Mucilaginibacter sp.]